jgi:hypothetical protein
MATRAGEDSDIRISGSEVYGGTGTSLTADDAIDIVAAQSTLYWPSSYMASRRRTLVRRKNRRSAQSLALAVSSLDRSEATCLP